MRMKGDVSYWGIHPYDFTLVIVLGDTIEACKAEYTKITGNSINDVLEPSAALCTYDYNAKSGSHIFILIPKKTTKRHDTIAHECLHAVNFVFAARGVKWDYDNDEPATYLLSYITRCVYSAITDAKKRIKKKARA